MKKLLFIVLLVSTLCSYAQVKSPIADTSQITASDGYCDIVILGDGFGQRLDTTFQRYAEVYKLNLLSREPFASLSFHLRFWYINSKQNLGCSTTGGLETALVCSWDKVKKMLGKTPMDVMMIFAWKDNYGGAVGNIGAVGLNQASDVNAQCLPFEFRALNGVAIHEGGHIFGCPHDFVNCCHVMWYGTNGGCEIAGKPFTLEHQKIISDFINKTIQQ